jgi:hypothetical protein
MLQHADERLGLVDPAHLNQSLDSVRHKPGRNDFGGSDHVVNRHWFPQSELLGLRWIDYDDAARTLDVAGKVVRASGEGRQRVDETKSAADRRKVPSPQFAVEMLRIRRGLSYLGARAVIHQRRSGRKV